MGPITPLMESIMETNQPTPTALVQVGPKSHKSKYSRVQKSIETWSVWSKMALVEVGVSLPR